MKRDSASGDGYSIASITKEGFTTLDEKDIQRRLAKMKLS
jgi:20S proteasome alpha/beta subunit